MARKRRKSRKKGQRTGRVRGSKGRFLRTIGKGKK